MNVVERLGELDQVTEVVLLELRGLRFDEEIEADALDPFHDLDRFALPRHPDIEGLDDVPVPQNHADLAFIGLVQALEATLEQGGFRLVEQLYADGAAKVAVVGLPDLRHAPLPRPAAQVEALLHVDDLGLFLARAPDAALA